MIPTEAVSFCRTAPAWVPNPTSRVVRMRLRWPWVNTIAVRRAAVRSSLAMNASQRAVTWLRVSPPGQPSRNRSHPGCCSSISSRRQPLVRAVVVLGERVDHCGFDAGHAAASCFDGSLQRAGEDHRQGPFRQGGQQWWQPVGLTETLVDQRQVGAPRVATVLGPFRGTVADQEDELGAGDDRIGHDVTP